MRWIRFAILLLAVTILQAGFIDIIALTSARIRPNMLLILLAFFCMHAPAPDAIISSFIIGLAADIIGHTIGPQMLSFGIFGTLLSEMRRLVIVRKMSYQSLVILLLGILTMLCARFLTLFKASSLPADLWQTLLWEPFYSAVIGPLLFVPLCLYMKMPSLRRKQVTY